jgi:hypothetical protein
VDVDALARELDSGALRVLRALLENDGQATTPEIRDATRLGNKQVAHRRSRLCEFGLIVAHDDPDPPDRYPHPPKEHILTDKGRAAIEAGVLEHEELPAPDDFAELVELVRDLHRQVRAFDSRLEAVEDRAETLDARLSKGRGMYPTLKQRLAKLDEQIEAHEEIHEDLEERLEGKKDKRSYFS